MVPCEIRNKSLNAFVEIKVTQVSGGMGDVPLTFHKDQFWDLAKSDDNSVRLEIPLCAFDFE